MGAPAVPEGPEAHRVDDHALALQSESADRDRRSRCRLGQVHDPCRISAAESQRRDRTPMDASVFCLAGR